MTERLVTLSGGPLDGLQVKTSSGCIEALAEGYDIWRYYPNAEGEPWRGALHKCPIGHVEHRACSQCQTPDATCLDRVGSNGCCDRCFISNRNSHDPDYTKS